jgi:ribosomal protein L29
MKIAEMRKLEDAKLHDLLIKKRTELGELQQGLVTGKVKNHRQRQQLKREIAQTLTIINEKRK